MTLRMHPRSSIVAQGRGEIEMLLLGLSRQLTYDQLYTCLSLSLSQLVDGMCGGTEAVAVLADATRAGRSKLLRKWVTGVAEIASRHVLTYGELFSTFGLIMAEHAKYQIRHERHPHDAEKRGDEA